MYASRDTIISLCTLRGLQSLVGDDGVEETPVPIPNTEVKLASPMILLRGKVGYRRLHGPCWGNSAGPIFLRYRFAAGEGTVSWSSVQRWVGLRRLLGGDGHFGSDGMVALSTLITSTFAPPRGNLLECIAYAPVRWVG
jgi:hypothetical protein